MERDRQTDRQTYGRTDTQTHRQRQRQRKTDRQTETEKHTHTHTHTHARAQTDRRERGTELAGVSIKRLNRGKLKILRDANNGRKGV